MIENVIYTDKIGKIDSWHQNTNTIIGLIGLEIMGLMFNEDLTKLMKIPLIIGIGTSSTRELISKEEK